MIVEKGGWKLSRVSRESGLKPSGAQRWPAPSRPRPDGATREQRDSINVLIVDNCSLGAIGIAEILKSRWKNAEILHARSGHPIKSLLTGGAWDLVLVEIDLADQSGLRLLQWARTISPGVRVLAMSSGEESVQGVRALQAGSAGFLHRGGTAEDLLSAVENVLEGKHYISRRLAETLARRVDMPASNGGDLDEVLSPREAEILQALAQGESIKHIGRRLEISPKTVSTYRRRILEKMHLRNDADIVKYCWAKMGVALRP